MGNIIMNTENRSEHDNLKQVIEEEKNYLEL